MLAYYEKQTPPQEEERKMKSENDDHPRRVRKTHTHNTMCIIIIVVDLETDWLTLLAQLRLGKNLFFHLNPFNSFLRGEETAEKTGRVDWILIVVRSSSGVTEVVMMTDFKIEPYSSELMRIINHNYCGLRWNFPLVFPLRLVKVKSMCAINECCSAEL